MNIEVEVNEYDNDGAGESLGLDSTSDHDENEENSENEDAEDVEIIRNVGLQTFHQNQAVADLDRELDDLISKYCGCQKNSGKDCVTAFSREDLLNLREEAMALDFYDDSHTNRLDLVVISALRVCKRTTELTASSKKEAHQRMRTRLDFHIKGISVCEKVFLFCHGIGRTRLKRLTKQYSKFGLVEVLHGNTNRTPANATKFGSAKHVSTFLLNYAEQNALYLPGRVATCRDWSVKLLPKSDTKQAVYAKYKASSEAAQLLPVSYYVFAMIWRQCHLNIQIQKGMTDLCGTCQKSYTSLHTFNGYDLTKRLEMIDKNRQHLTDAKREREYYNSLIADTRKSIEPYQVTMNQARCSAPYHMHLSFDMAQQVHVPSNPLQPGPLYFLTPYRVAIFGLMNDTMKKQANYLIPESVNCGKGANLIVSLLHHYLQTKVSGERTLHLHADNARSQNKNNIMMWYLLLLVNLGNYEEITLSFLVPGHTKFSCDWAFGLLKSAFRRNFVSCLQDLVNVTNGSTPVSKVNEAILVGDEQGNVFIPYYDWKKYFTAMNHKRIPDLSKYHHFIFRKTCANSVFVKVSVDDQETEISLVPITDSVGVIQFQLDHLEAVVPQGLSLERKKYLFDKIREYCAPGTEDILCPRPTETTEDAENEDDPAPLNNPNASSDTEPFNSVPCRPRRGRPRKTQKENNDPVLLAELDQPPLANPEQSVNPVPCPRRRGRPRKILTEIDASHAQHSKRMCVERETRTLNFDEY